MSRRKDYERNKGNRTHQANRPLDPLPLAAETIERPFEVLFARIADFQGSKLVFHELPRVARRKEIWLNLSDDSWPQLAHGVGVHVVVTGVRVVLDGEVVKKGFCTSDVSFAIVVLQTLSFRQYRLEEGKRL